MTKKDRKSVRNINLIARGEPFLWEMGGALTVGVIMIVAFLILILYNGAIAFFPKPIYEIHLKNKTSFAGEPVRTEAFTPSEAILGELDLKTRRFIEIEQGSTQRTLYKTGNFDLYNEDFKWISNFEILSSNAPDKIYYIERVEWGPFVGYIDRLYLGGRSIKYDFSTEKKVLLKRQLKNAQARRKEIRVIEGKKIGRVNHALEKERLSMKSILKRKGIESPEYKSAYSAYQNQKEMLESAYRDLSDKANDIKKTDMEYRVLLKDINGRAKEIQLSHIVRLYPANSLSLSGKIKIYIARWFEYLTHEPREANTEGGVMPAIFGTFIMTLLMVIVVAPFGIMAALYLREYAKQGKLVSIVRICVNNLAGVPSIVYGVFGLGFFAYVLGGNIDQLFFAERLPNPTFGTGGILWAAFTLALLTVPVVIVATEEAIAAVPPSLREGALACGASKWQTIKHIVLPKAMPGIMTGLILAMARGAGEVAPLMLVGVVKLAPELPLDTYFPFIHLERSFMHLGFHIFDVGFQSRNSEAGKPMVFVTTLLLITLVAIMNAAAIYIRNRLKRKYLAGHF